MVRQGPKGLIACFVSRESLRALQKRKRASLMRSDYLGKKGISIPCHACVSQFHAYLAFRKETNNLLMHVMLAIYMSDTSLG